MKKRMFGLGLVVTVSAAATALLTYHSTRRLIRRQCKKQVRGELGKIPFVTDEYAGEQADKICKV